MPRRQYRSAEELVAALATCKTCGINTAHVPHDRECWEARCRIVISRPAVDGELLNFEYHPVCNQPLSSPVHSDEAAKPTTFYNDDLRYPLDAVEPNEVHRFYPQ